MTRLLRQRQPCTSLRRGSVWSVPLQSQTSRSIVGLHVGKSTAIALPYSSAPSSSTPLLFHFAPYFLAAQPPSSAPGAIKKEQHKLSLRCIDLKRRIQDAKDEVSLAQMTKTAIAKWMKTLELKSRSLRAKKRVCNNCLETLPPPILNRDGRKAPLFWQRMKSRLPVMGQNCSFPFLRNALVRPSEICPCSKAAAKRWTRCAHIVSKKLLTIFQTLLCSNNPGMGCQLGKIMYAVLRKLSRFCKRDGVCTSREWMTDQSISSRIRKQILQKSSPHR